MIKVLFGTEIRFFDTNPLGRITNRFSKDIGGIDDSLPLLFLTFTDVHNIYIYIYINLDIIPKYGDNWLNDLR